MVSFNVPHIGNAIVVDGDGRIQRRAGEIGIAYRLPAVAVGIPKNIGSRISTDDVGNVVSLINGKEPVGVGIPEFKIQPGTFIFPDTIGILPHLVGNAIAADIF